MRTTPDQLMYLLIDEAQDLLDEQDPGYEIAVAYSGTSVVLDPDGRVVFIMKPDGAIKRNPEYFMPTPFPPLSPNTCGSS